MAAAGCNHLQLRELVRFSVAGDQLRYDEEGRQLLLLRHHGFESVPFGPGRDLAAASVSCPNLGPVLDVRFSPAPLRWVAVQRSPTDLELRHLDSGAVHLRQCRPSRAARSGRILAFHWTGSKLCDLVIVGTWGADFFALASKGLKLVRSVSLPVSWSIYSHETRMVLLASGKHDSEIHGMQVQPSGIIKAPKFEVALPPVPASAAPTPLSPGQHARSLRRADLALVCLHGLIYVCHLDGPSRQLVLYQLFRDFVVRKHTVALPSSELAVSVVDSLLAVHCLDQDVSMILDLRMNAQQPIIAPLPIGLRPGERGDHC